LIGASIGAAGTGQVWIGVGLGYSLSPLRIKKFDFNKMGHVLIFFKAL
jgi:hypothetical protein